MTHRKKKHNKNLTNPPITYAYKELTSKHNKVHHAPNQNLHPEARKKNSKRGYRVY
jgi:hypothetical protein